MSNLQDSEKPNKLLLSISIIGLASCLLLLFPYTQTLIIGIGEKFIGRNFDNGKWMQVISQYWGITALCFGFIILHLTIKPDLEICKKIFIIAAIVISCISIIVIITMQIRVRSLWTDEAFLARNIISRDWSTLLVPPLSSLQSAPVLYVIVVKLLGSLFGYSEFSLRLFSFLAFIALLISEKEFTRKALNYDNYQTAFVVAATAGLPIFIWYSNEFKPYMGDALFVVLTLFSYFCYTQGKIKLPLLTALCIIFFGFSTPVIFFTGGIFIYEFALSVIRKNKKMALSVFGCGALILVISVLYYNWWHSSVLGGMQSFWGSFAEENSLLKRLLTLFRGINNSDASFLVILVPLALIGIISFIKFQNKIAYPVLISLVLVFAASFMGFWPLTGRLWLFFPAIVLIFTPAGIDFIHARITNKRITRLIEFSFFSAIVLFYAINTLGFTGNKMFFPGQEVNPLIYYVKNHIKDGEKLYLYSASTFGYKMGYSTTRIGNVHEDNILFSSDTNQWSHDRPGSELESILKHERVYLIFQHHLFGKGIANGLDILRNHGTITEILNIHDTPLYLFERHTTVDK